MARRFGVNLVMYALTGNYKTDQVHVPAPCWSASANDRLQRRLRPVAAAGRPSSPRPAVAVLALAWGVWRRARGIGWRGLVPRPLLAALPTRSCAASSASRSTTSSLLVTDQLAQPAPRTTGRSRPTKAEDGFAASVAATARPRAARGRPRRRRPGRDDAVRHACARPWPRPTARGCGAVVALTDGAGARRSQGPPAPSRPRCTPC